MSNKKQIELCVQIARICNHKMILLKQMNLLVKAEIERKLRDVYMYEARQFKADDLPPYCKSTTV